MNPKYPVYIISKGRWESRLTSKAFEQMGVPYHIVVESQEYDQYAAVIAPEKIKVLPFSNLGQGSIPARNWVWEDSIARGAERHWIMDDNINGFYRYYPPHRVPVSSGTTLKAAEDFVDRYENIAIAGFQYRYFCVPKQARRAFALNARIYSCMLIQNNIPYRWRGRYNEDTDLSIRVLKDGWCTVLFFAFLADKMTTLTMKGGNSAELYQRDGRRKMAESLVAQHPDVTSIVWKWNRWQHKVNYEPFKKNKLRLKSGIQIPEGVNEYGMALRLTETNRYSRNFQPEEIRQMEERRQKAQETWEENPTVAR